MAKAVFIQSSRSEYDDRPGVAYHFPKRNYLSVVLQTLGDWVLFYEGRAGGGRGYYSVQKVLKVEDDPIDPSRAYAILDQGSELSFEQNVARLKEDGVPYETGLPLSRGKNSSAVRLVSDADFYAILEKGFQPQTLPDAMPRHDDLEPHFQFSDEAAEFVMAPHRRVLQSRVVREQSFTRQVKIAYGGRCAISGLELRNGGGRPEVEAAHILPVAHSGPNTVRNGLALSGTVHWMFDRGLISVDEDHSILVANDSVADPSIGRLICADKKLMVPKSPSLQPHRQYLRWHRDNVFKG